MFKVYNEDCLQTMDKIIKAGGKVDLVLTSPPYNTGRQTTSERARNENECRYDIHIDNLSSDDYCKWCVDIFNKIDSFLVENGVVLWNVSYGNDATGNKESIGLVWFAIADIIRQTNFTVADRIIWKKNQRYQTIQAKINLQEFVKMYLFFAENLRLKLLMQIRRLQVLTQRGKIITKMYLILLKRKIMMVYAN